ncbi:MAG: hypothetical protein ACRCXD_19255 [Luteolibacter sp.]
MKFPTSRPLGRVVAPPPGRVTAPLPGRSPTPPPGRVTAPLPGRAGNPPTGRDGSCEGLLVEGSCDTPPPPTEGRLPTEGRVEADDGGRRPPLDGFWVGREPVDGLETEPPLVGRE